MTNRPDSRRDGHSRERRDLPVVTASVLLVTSAVTAANVFVPGIARTLRRDPTKLSAGEWWRLVTPLFVQTDRWWQILAVFALVAIVGVAFERHFGGRRWLLVYFGSGFVAEIVGYAWQPYGSGASVGGAGLLGGLFVWLAVRGDGLPWRIRFWGPTGLVGAVVLVALHDIHGPPVLVGACMTVASWWRPTARSDGR